MHPAATRSSQQTIEQFGKYVIPNYKRYPVCIVHGEGTAVWDEFGAKLNVNADTAAAAVARLIQAEKLVFLSDVPGIFLDRKDPSTLQSHLTAARCRELIHDGVIDAGMVPKVEAALEALQAGVQKVHIIDARIPHSVLLEIYSNEGIGTEIVL